MKTCRYCGELGYKDKYGRKYSICKKCKKKKNSNAGKSVYSKKNIKKRLELKSTKVCIICNSPAYTDSVGKKYNKCLKCLNKKQKVAKPGKCKCGKNLFVDLYGIKYTKCKECISKTSQNSQINRFKKISEHKKLSNSQIKRWSDNKERLKQSKKLSKIYENKELRKQLSSIHINIYKNNPSIKDKISKSIIKHHSSLEYRNNLSKKLKKVHEDNPHISKNTALKNKQIMSTPEYIKKQKIIMKEVCNRPEYIEKQRNISLKRFENPKELLKISNGVKKYFEKHPRTESSTKNYRIGRLKYLENQFKKYQYIKPRLGKNEKQLLDKIEMEKNIILMRQFSLDGLGYFVDGYDPINNIVYEVDEKHHEKQVEKDLIREKEIKEYLDCEFVRIKDY